MKQVLLLIGLCIAGFTAFAQPKKVVADKIVGQVGDKIILQSDILNAIADYRRQGQEAQLPENADCSFLEGQLIQKALVLQAEKDSLPVSDEEIEAALDNQIRGFIRAYGSEEVLREVSGRTVYQLKDDFRTAFRERKLADQMRAKIVENIKITPNEVKAYFNRIPTDSLPYYESEIEVSQIVAIPKANAEVEEYITEQLLQYKKQVETGAKRFEQIAREKSDDTETERQGGTLTINRADKKVWDPAFFATVFTLKEGQISNVVKSKFGFHIIQVVSRSGDDAIVRHILRIPPITEDEVALSKAKLDSVRKLLVNGNISFNEAVNKFSDDENAKFNAGAVTNRENSTYLIIDELDKDMVITIRDLKPGEFSKPQVFTDERGQKKVRIVYLKSRSEAHIENLRDDYSKIAQKALEKKKQDALEKWFKDHLPNYYIIIDKDYGHCDNLKEWMEYANTK